MISPVIFFALSAFLKGLLIVLAAIAVIAVLVLTAQWLKDLVKKKLDNRKKHKVAFADTREIVDEYLAQKVEEADEISMDELERMCAKSPYVAAVVNEETGEISEYEGIAPTEINENFKANLKRQSGMIIIGE